MKSPRAIVLLASPVNSFNDAARRWDVNGGPGICVDRFLGLMSFSAMILFIFAPTLDKYKNPVFLK